MAPAICRSGAGRRLPHIKSGEDRAVIPRTLFAEEHNIFRETARRFMEEHVVPNHQQWEKDGVLSRDAWEKAGAAGLLLTNIPEEYGGMGGDFLYSAVVLEEQAATGCTGPGFNLHSDIVAPYLLHYGTEDLKRKWLPKMATGEVITGIGMTEPGGGSDLQNLKTTAIRDGDEYVITGQKVFITNGQLLDFVLLAAKTDPQAGGRGISQIIVEAGRPGFTKGRNLEKIGFKAQDTSELFFDNVRVPVTNLVGEEGRGFKQMMQELAQERLIQAVRGAVTIEAMLRWTVEYTRNRKAFGQTVADFQNTRFKLAEVRTQAVVARTFVDRCLELHVQGGLDSVDAAMAKMFVTDLQCQVADECLQLHGGYGYMWEYPIARAWADGRLTRIAGGTAEIMKEIISRDLLKG